MLSVSSDFLTAIRANTRKLDAYIMINFADAFLDPSFEYAVNNVCNIDLSNQLINSKKVASYKYLSCDGSCSLDESYHPAPATYEDAKKYEFGYWSLSLSESDGTFLIEPEISILYSERAISGLQIYFDEKRGEYAKDFDIKFYDKNDDLIETIEITDNTDINANISFDLVLNSVKYVLVIKKWSEGGRNAKIFETTPSLILRINNDRLVSMNIIEQRESQEGEGLPIGNIASNQLVVDIINENGELNPFSNSIYSNQIKLNKRVNTFIGVWTGETYEYVSTGVFYIKEWDIETNGFSVTLTCQDRLTILKDNKYSNNVIEKDINVYEAFEKVFIVAGLDILDFKIDSEYNNSIYNIDYLYFDNISYYDCLKQLAAASNSVVYVNRNNQIIVKKITKYKIAASEEYNQSNYYNSVIPLEFGNMANIVSVTTQKLTPVIDQEIYNESKEIEAGATVTFSIKYNQLPCENSAIDISGFPSGVNLLSANYYSYGADFEIENTTSGNEEINIIVNGDYYEIKNGETIKKQDDNKIQEDGELPHEITINSFVQNEAIAEKITTDILEFFKYPSRNLELETPCNPALELGDKINYTDAYGQSGFNIVKSEILYNGGLSCKLKAIRQRDLKIYDLYTNDDYNFYFSDGSNFVVAQKEEE